MTDVRLTATNPEDSSVVPVACNDKGELKLEEPIAFDGDLDGDLTVNGTGVFQGRVKAGSAANSGQTVDYGITSYANQASIGNAAAVFGENENSAGRNWCGCKPDGSISSEIFSDGSASFAGTKAGFTSDGELYFYSNNVRYRAVVQGGSVTAQTYTREMEMQEKLESLNRPNKLPESQ